MTNKISLSAEERAVFAKLLKRWEGETLSRPGADEVLQIAARLRDAAFPEAGARARFNWMLYETGLGNHPIFIDLMAGLGRLMLEEHGGIPRQAKVPKYLREHRWKVKD